MKFTRPLILPASLLAVVFGLLACTTPQPQPPAKPAPNWQPVSFDSLPGWQQDDLRQAWPALMTSCDVIGNRPVWKEPCAVAKTVAATDDKAVRLFFESFFTPYRMVNPDGNEQGLVTGYYEPLLRGARKRGGSYQTALHRVPDDMLTIEMGSVYPELKTMRLRGKLAGRKIVPYPSRAELEQSNALNGLELVWVDDPIDAFFLQVQGSGRVQLADGNETVRLAYADQNGHPYKSIGRYLVDKGEMTLAQASAQSIKAWALANPARLRELLNANPSYVFFKEEKITDPQQGPKGALGVPLTSGRSIAIDPRHIPLGAPVYLATTYPNQSRVLQQLMLAQDTGGAIRGVVRADYFWGFGAQAGEQAGKMKQQGKMWVLWPKGAPLPEMAAN